MAWGLADAASRGGGTSLPIPTVGKLDGTWGGVAARAVTALRALAARREVTRGRPLVYVPDASLTPGTALRALALQLVTGASASIIVAAQVRRPSRALRFLPRVLRTRVVTLDTRYARALRNDGFCALATTPGLDSRAFSPRAQSEHAAARRVLGLDEHVPCVLHVGHLKPNRGLEVLAAIATTGRVRVVMVASTWSSPESSILQLLSESGVAVITRDLPEVRTAYVAADAYVFPTVSREGAIGLPLSVLEAAAVGVPIVSTRFNDLPMLLPEGHGIHYCDTPAELCASVLAVIAGELTVGCSPALPTWDDVLMRVLGETTSAAVQGCS